MECSVTPSARTAGSRDTRARSRHRSARGSSRLDGTVLTLVDFHGSPVWILDDDPATSRHLLMPTQERCLEASQFSSDRIQGINVETGE